MEVAVEVKGDFLCLVQNRFSTEDFVGNRYQLEYVIESDLLHGGKNYGEIVIRTPYETLTYTVVVSQTRQRAVIGESRQKNGSSFYLLIYSVKPEKLRRKCGLRRQKDISKEGSRKIRTMIYICYYKHSLPY